MIFDTHAHYDDEQFDADREELLGSLKEGSVDAVVNVGASLASSRAAVALAGRYPFMYAAAGVHPDHAAELDEESFSQLRELCRQEKVVAVGEIGLDYYWDESPRDVQKKWFIRQMELARELSLPVNIHSRDAAEDTLEIVREHGRDLPGVIHCFSYSKEIACAYVKMGYYIGVGGVVTFKNGRRLKETVAEIPLTSIVLETDCPYLAPEPNRGKRNSSLNLVYVAREIARIKDVPYDEVVACTARNARTLYRLDR
ncbi:TatD family hydrolase [Mordavella massiliensis]|uniref:TatD family hydrolase n=1 Tax=Mordavella massiliensis TaxID=1871024 RepID=A0A939BGU7_9CLOT|nr:TatD family hydrolase [Mordavella massiliensis]MBM6948593.1 TatD family hydrolase [Mordavella massiliensis]